MEGPCRTRCWPSWWPVSSGNQRLTDKEEKVAEELAASAARLEKLSNDKEAMAILATLAKVAESDVGDEKVMSSYVCDGASRGARTSFSQRAGAGVFEGAAGRR